MTEVWSRIIVAPGKKIQLVELYLNIGYFLIESIELLFTIVKIFIWIQRYVALNCNDKVYTF